MTTRALSAAHQVAALGAPHAYSTGNLLADCERWCRDHLPPRRIHDEASRPDHRAHQRQLPAAMSQA